MNRNTLKSQTSLAIASLLASAASQADWSANVGFASDYFYRGIFQAPSSASAGLDFESNGFYAGTWAADVADGLEIDGYFGYAKEFGGIDVGIGFTGYYYTGDFDDTYQEINLTTGYGIATLDVALGEYDNFDGGTQDYAWYALTLAKNGFYGRIASFNRDFDGEYVELGYDFSLAEVDLGIKAIVSNEDLTGDNEEALVFTIGKSFDF
ncbi:MAG: TorF family putative porin [Woeseiaceae bacterium]